MPEEMGEETGGNDTRGPIKWIGSHWKNNRRFELIQAGFLVCAVVGSLWNIGRAWSAGWTIGLAMLGARPLIRMPDEIHLRHDHNDVNAEAKQQTMDERVAAWSNWHRLSRQRFISIASCTLALPIAILMLLQERDYPAAWLSVLANTFVVAATSMIYLREYDDLGIGEFTTARQSLVLKLVYRWRVGWKKPAELANEDSPREEPPEWFGIAATDVFVEKAQAILSRRAIIMYATGVVSLLATIGVLITGAFFANEHLTDKMPIDFDGYKFVVKLVQMLGFAAFFFVAATILVSVSHSFFHEATVLYARRHALRFGRLYVYLKKGLVDFKELEEAFQWNRDAASAFKSPKLTQMMSTLQGKLVDSVDRLAGKIIDNVVDQKNDFDPSKADGNSQDKNPNSNPPKVDGKS